MQSKPNLEKCIFKVSAGKFFRFMILQRGIGANLEKIKAIFDMQPLRSVKEVQKLARQVVALNKFMSKLVDKCWPLIVK